MSDSDPYYDALETRSADAREAAFMEALPRIVSNAKTCAPGFSRILQAVEPREVTTRTPWRNCRSRGNPT